MTGVRIGDVVKPQAEKPLLTPQNGSAFVTSTEADVIGHNESSLRVPPTGLDRAQDSGAYDVHMASWKAKRTPRKETP